MIRENVSFLITFPSEGRKQLAVPKKAGRWVNVLRHPKNVLLFALACFLGGNKVDVTAVGGTDQPLRSGGYKVRERRAIQRDSMVSIPRNSNEEEQNNVNKIITI